MSSILALSLLLLGGGAQPLSRTPAPLTLRVDGDVLLTDSRFSLAPPLLMGAGGQEVSSSPWLNHPLKVRGETAGAYVLSDGREQVWLPKRDLHAKAVFPLTRDGETDRLARELKGRTVWVNGHPSFPCEIVPGYHAEVTLKSARVDSVWRVEGHLFPKVQGSSGAILVMLREPEDLGVLSASMDPSLQDQSPQLMAQAPERCTRLPALYANTGSLWRTLTTSRPAATPALPNDLDAREKALIGWTRAQVLAQYGSPNEEGSLAEIMKLKAWHYGDSPYARVLFRFSPEGRVTQASFARSP